MASLRSDVCSGGSIITMGASTPSLSISPYVKVRPWADEKLAASTAASKTWVKRESTQ
jgi:hypothetical protein